MGEALENKDMEATETPAPDAEAVIEQVPDNVRVLRPASKAVEGMTELELNALNERTRACVRFWAEIQRVGL